MMDPPDHGRFRGLVSRAFTPKAVAGLEPRFRALARTIVDDALRTQAAAGSEPIDLVAALAVPLPLQVIADMLGMSDVDRDQFRIWSDETIKAADGLRADLAVVGEFLGAMGAAIADHRANPRDDVLQRLVDADLDGRALDQGELLVYAMSLLVAGNETTRNLVSGGLLALAAHPDQRAWLAADAARTPGAVEELLRWVTPIKAMCRTVVGGEVELGGTALDDGDVLVLLYGSANRDETVWGPTADRLDLARPVAGPQLAFGFGEHLCLGAALARREARVLFEEILARCSDFEIVAPPDRLASTLINGWSRIDGVLR
jgi:cytochrome P450